MTIEGWICNRRQLGKMQESQEITSAVQRLYDTYPFPPEALLDEPPPGYNWRWNWPVAHAFCTGRKPDRPNARILDAGCGTGVGTEYLVHLNPEARVTGIDLSSGALSVARERCERSGGGDRVEFHHLSLYDVGQLEGEFDLINCVGVLHHLPDPIAGIRALAPKLAPGGIMHVFVYGELGRWEVRLMQQAIALLQGDKRGDYTDGVALGRRVFEVLPEHNRLVKREKERWSLENRRDANFADMYLHPQEIDYNIETLFELIEASGLEFVGFSNPEFWSVERLLGKAPELLERAGSLGDRDRYRLIELLDPEVTHYEFFLARPPFVKTDWTDERALARARVELSPCLQGWPSQELFDYNYNIVRLSEAEYEFMSACAKAPTPPTVGEIIERVTLDFEGVRSLQRRQLVLLAAAS